MRTFAGSVALVLLTAACADLPTATTPTPPSGPGAEGFQARLSCTATIATGRVACTSEQTEGSESRPSLIIGGQDVYVRLEATGASYTPADSIFQIDVTVQNLMTQTFGASDDSTDTGLTVFFYAGPTTTAGQGSVSVDNEDGTSVFLVGATEYFTYDGLLFTGEMTEGKPWRFKTDPEVASFHFQVFVQGQLPHEQSLLRFRPSYLGEVYVNGLWGAASNEIFAVGSSGGLLRLTGGSWITDPALNEEELWDVWGSSATDVFAVGDFGTIVHWNGTAWTEMDSGLGCGCQTLWGVWGSAPDDVWAVGDEGLILHYDGVEWVTHDTVPATWLTAVWGSGPNDVFAVGTDGAIFHYDGTGWTAMNSGLAEEDGHIVLSVWGTSSTNVYAGFTGGVLHYDGTEWSPLEGARECPTFDVWASAPDDVFVANICGIDHYDGASWAHMDPGEGGIATDIIGFGPHNILANTDYYVFRGIR
ncbi:hypothetical protein [Longimicrobium sp.]|uniref:hypothetical protein n=1 Tax=Longimicrobium sp. TaxID=2029185 RepID=UPI003B3B379D